MNEFNDLQSHSTSREDDLEDRQWVKLTAEWQQERFRGMKARRKRQQDIGRCRYPAEGKEMCDFHCGGCVYFHPPQTEEEVAPMRHISELLAEYFADLANRAH